MSLTVLGGGLGGLSAGHYILKSFRKKVLLVEKSDKLGGWVKSYKDPITGIILEEGPHTIRARGKLARNTLKLVEELNLTEKIKAVPGTDPASSKRLIYVHEKLHYLPSSFSSLMKKIPPFSKPLIFSVYNLLFARTKICHDESIYDFAFRRFGKEVADYVISPMICGICAGNPKEISVNFLMSSLFEAEQKHGSIIKGLWKENFFSKHDDSEEPSNLCDRAKKENWSVWGLDGGLGTLTKALENSVKEKGGSIMLSSPVNKITFLSDEVIVDIDGKQHSTSHIVSAIPAKKLSSLLFQQHPYLARYLSEIPYVSVAVVNLVYPGKVLDYNAFGFLVPPSEKISLLGVIFDSCIFPQGNKTILTAMIGGSWFVEHLGRHPSHESILETTLMNLGTTLGIYEKPESYHVSILQDCIPQYTIGHRDRIARIYNYINSKKLPISLIGSSYNGVGVNDVINSAKNVTNEIT